MKKLLASLLLLLPTAALAQGGQFELTPTLIYRFQGDIDVDDRNFLDESLDIEEGEAYGIRIDIPINDNFQIELLADRQETELSVSGGLFEDDTRFADLDLSYYHVGGLWQFGSGQVKPFLVASIGLARLEIDLPNTQTEDRLSGSLGGGAKIFFGDHVGLRLEGRGYWIDLEEDDDDRDRDRWEDESSISQGEASVGLIFAW
ncbi:MAG TPA: outer membrane beta-barrel protein [Thermoanaerobaculia bacterium]|nr:outer membrane beta-barrel protein [Thermoanaerobaculia bacterium]